MEDVLYLLLYYNFDATEKRKDGMQLITGPLDPRHIGGMQNIMHLGDPLAQQSKFNVEVKAKVSKSIIS